MNALLERLSGGHVASIEDQEFAARKSANLVLWIILGFFAIFVVWASLTQINRTVRGMGKVVPSSKLQVVSNLEGGVIEEILVRVGQNVRRGDVLVRLSPTLSGAAYGSSHAEVDALQAKIARLNAEVRGTSPGYGAASADQIAIEQSLHSARMAELQGAMAASQARIHQAERAVVESQSMLEARQSNLSTAQRELEMLRPLVQTKVISQVEFIKAENAALVAQKEVDSAQASLARARAAVAEAAASSAQTRSDWMSRAGSELSQAQAELSAKSQQLPALSDRVDRTVIRAPMTGKVNRVLVTTVGGSVTAGMPIAEIVPSDDALYVEAQIRPQDIGNVRIGQEAQLEITAYNRAVYGTMKGTVTAISPDATLNEKTGETFYQVEVQTTDQMRDKNGNLLAIGPGMVANVDLLGDKRSVLSYIFTPLTRLTQTAFRD